MTTVPVREIRLIDNLKRVAPQRVLDVDQAKQLIGCDFYVEGIERAASSWAATGTVGSSTSTTMP